MKFSGRITIDSKINGGKPSLRHMRFTVTQMLELLAAGMSHQEILNDYPFIEKEDIYACLEYAANLSNTKSVVTL